MKLITQPEAGTRPLLAAVRRARKTTDIVVFRFDLEDLEQELEATVKRGVVVRALIAHTNRGGESTLRKLEQRLAVIAHKVVVSAADRHARLEQRWPAAVVSAFRRTCRVRLKPDTTYDRRTFASCCG